MRNVSLLFLLTAMVINCSFYAQADTNKPVGDFGVGKTKNFKSNKINANEVAVTGTLQMESLGKKPPTKVRGSLVTDSLKMPKNTKPVGDFEQPTPNGPDPALFKHPQQPKYLGR